jgi:TATA-binding protein-associated factor Taf7
VKATKDESDDDDDDDDDNGNSDDDDDKREVQEHADLVGPVVTPRMLLFRS